MFQNLTFANAAFMSQVLRRFDCPVLLWTLREPVIDGGRLRLNSLTGAYSAANALAAFDGKPFHWCFGAPEEERVVAAVKAAYGAAKLKKAMRSLTVASIGHTPEGFGFGRALDSEMMSTFGVELQSIEARELIERAKGYSDEECAEYLRKTEDCTAGFAKTPEKNQLDHARLLKAYSDYVKENHIGALSSRCWPDFFTSFGTPVCTVLSMLNDAGVAAACEADAYGALSMWMGMQLSGEAVFFGDPVALDETESTITYWHCGMAACSLARRDTGAVVGVHPNRKIGPAMDFGCEAFADATVFRIGRKPDGSFRFFIAEGSVLDKPKQFIGTSIVVKTDESKHRGALQTVSHRVRKARRAARPGRMLPLYSGAAGADRPAVAVLARKISNRRTQTGAPVFYCIARVRDYFSRPLFVLTTWRKISSKRQSASSMISGVSAREV